MFQVKHGGHFLLEPMAKNRMIFLGQKEADSELNHLIYSDTEEWKVYNPEKEKQYT